MRNNQQKVILRFFMILKCEFRCVVEKRYEGEDIVNKLSETKILKYSYETKEEREQHVKWMESQGFHCTGQVKNTDDSIYAKEQKYYYYGEFFKHY